MREELFSKDELMELEALSIVASECYEGKCISDDDDTSTMLGNGVNWSDFA